MVGQYRLQGVVMHHGVSIPNGHYSAYTRRAIARHGMDEWLYCNDALCSSVSNNEVFSEESHQDVYVMIYELYNETHGVSGDIVADLAQRAAELDVNVVFSDENLRVKDLRALDSTQLELELSARSIPFCTRYGPSVDSNLDSNLKSINRYLKQKS
jgi:hypothetical protein